MEYILYFYSYDYDKKVMSLSLFLDSIRSEETRKHYSLYLQKYFEFAGSNLDNAESKIIHFITKLKKKGKSHGTYV